MTHRPIAYALAALIAAGAAAGKARGDSSPPAQATPARATPAQAAEISFKFDPKQSPLPLELHERVVEVIEQIYGFKFDEAIAKARDIRSADPGNPLGDFLLSEAYWWQAINNRDRPELSARFRDYAQATIAGSEKRLERDEEDALALFFLGSANGRKAILDGLEGHRFESVNTSVKARKYLKLLNKYHPEIEDAYSGLGIYDYFAAQLPWFARILSKLLLGLGGDRERGITELERAAHHGLFTQVEARIFLAIAYLDTEGRYPEALGILKELNTRYPENLDFYGMLAYAFRTQHDYGNAIRMLETLVGRGEHAPAFGHQSRQMSAYFLASTYKVAGDFDKAMPVLDRLVAQVDPRAEWIAASSLLERGRIHDARGQRQAALADYRAVLDLRDFRGSRDKARAYIDQPCVVSEEERSHYLAGTGGAEADGAQQAGGAAGGSTP